MLNLNARVLVGVGLAVVLGGLLISSGGSAALPLVTMTVTPVGDAPVTATMGPPAVPQAQQFTFAPVEPVSADELAATAEVLQARLESLHYIAAVRVTADATLTVEVRTPIEAAVLDAVLAQSGVITFSLLPPDLLATVQPNYGWLTAQDASADWLGSSAALHVTGLTRASPEQWWVDFTWAAAVDPPDQPLGISLDGELVGVILPGASATTALPRLDALRLAASLASGPLPVALDLVAQHDLARSNLPTATITPTLTPSATPTPTFTPSPTPIPPEPYVILQMDADLYGGPGTAYQAAAHVYAGEALPIRGVDETGTWVQVVWWGYRDFWLPVAQGTVVGELDALPVVTVPLPLPTPASVTPPAQ